MFLIVRELISNTKELEWNKAGRVFIQAVEL